MEKAVFKGENLIQHLDNAFVGCNIAFEVNDVAFNGILEKGISVDTGNTYHVRDVMFFINNEKNYKCSYMRGRMTIKEVV